MSTTTDSSGAYAFVGLGSGSYAVQFHAPAGYSVSSPTDGYTVVVIDTDDVTVGAGVSGYGSGSESGSGSGSGSGSSLGSDSGHPIDHYPEYVAAVESATAQFQTAAANAYGQYQSGVSAANAAAQSHADTAHAQYLMEVIAAYSAYYSRYQAAYSAVEQALAGENT